MKDDVIKGVVFFVLIIVIMLSAIGTWRVVTMDISEGDERDGNVFPESKTGSGFVSININQKEGNNE
jgi:hypothetical protein